MLGNISHDYPSAIATLDRALEMNANSALAFGFSALVHMFCEDYPPAIEHALKALRLSPFDPLNYHPYLALAASHLFTDRFDDAVKYATLAVQSNPGFSPCHAVLVASLVESGQLDAARAAARRLLEAAPDFTVGGFARMDIWRSGPIERLAKAMLAAGLPQ